MSVLFIASVTGIPAISQWHSSCSCSGRALAGQRSALMERRVPGHRHLIIARRHLAGCLHEMHHEVLKCHSGGCMSTPWVH